MTEIALRLFVIDSTPASRRAIEELHRLCETEFQGHYTLTIINVLEQPEVAEAEKVLATPTLIRTGLPDRLVGDLSDTRRLRAWLGLAAVQTQGDQSSKEPT